MNERGDTVIANHWACECYGETGTIVHIGPFSNLIQFKRARHWLRDYQLINLSARYRACSRAWGLINRLPIEQRHKHYSRVTATRNKLRPVVTS